MEVAGRRRKRRLFLTPHRCFGRRSASAWATSGSRGRVPPAQTSPGGIRYAGAGRIRRCAHRGPLGSPGRHCRAAAHPAGRDTAAWDKSEAVAATIDTEYRNTDHRMVAVPMLGTVTNDYFNTVTFAGDSIASGLGIYDTGYHNAHYATYVSAGVQTFVNNVSVKNAVTGANETPMETIAASQPDYLYILVGTNNLVVQGSEDSFIAYYERLIDMLREQLNPGVTIYIQSIPGVQEDVVASKPGLDNTRIDAGARGVLGAVAGGLRVHPVEGSHARRRSGGRHEDERRGSMRDGHRGRRADRGRRPAHENPDQAAENVRAYLCAALDELCDVPTEELLRARRERSRSSRTSSPIRVAEPFISFERPGDAHAFPYGARTVFNVSCHHRVINC